MDCLVSVIIPAYNSEKFLERCIKSVLKCTDINLEVIVINDGSSDNTEKLVKSLALEDSRIRCFTQENQGVSAARNKGLSLASGKYIIFSDADDAFDGENLDKLVSCAENENADIVVFTRINNYADGRVVPLKVKGESFVVSDSYEYAFRNTILNQNNFGWSSCNKLFKRDIIEGNNIRFIDYKEINSEDRLFNLQYFMNVSKVAFCDNCSFTNFVRENSLSHSAKFPNCAERNIKAYEYVNEYLKYLPENVKFKLLRHYFISFLNNVAVLDLGTNKLGIKTTDKSFRKAINGMLSVLENKHNLIGFKNEKSIYYTENGVKYKLLNTLILNHSFYFFAEVILFGYVKVNDIKLLLKSKRKG